jgi:hypothetical protein
VVVVADCNNHRLALWHLGDGIVWRHLGSRGSEPGQFICPQAVAVTGAGALVVTDRNRVQVLTVDGAVLCVLSPMAVGGVGPLGSNLYGVAVCVGTDDILVTDYDNRRVVMLTWSSPSHVRAVSLCFLYLCVKCHGFVLYLVVVNRYKTFYVCFTYSLREWRYRVRAYRTVQVDVADDWFERVARAS